MSNRSRTASQPDLPTSDLDLDEPAGVIPPDDTPPTRPAIVEPEPDPTPPAWMATMCDRAMLDVSIWLSRLPAIRANLVRFLVEVEPLQDVGARDIGAAFDQAASTALNFPGVGQPEANAYRAWWDGVAVEVIHKRSAQLERAREKERLAAEAEAERKFRVDNAEKLAKEAEWLEWADKTTAYEAWLAEQAQPVA